MQQDKSCELLTLISIDSDDPECRAAFAEFHRRYKKYLWNLSYNAARSIDKENATKVAMVLTQNTFIKIFEKAGLFESRTDDSDKDCKRWIAGILKNIKLQYLEKNNSHKDHIVFMEIVPDKFCESEIDDVYKVASIERKILEKALAQLNEKERSVLLACYNFYSEGKVQKIDKEIKEALAKQFNVKVSSLKQIKRRAYQKLLKEIEKHIKIKQEVHE